MAALDEAEAIRQATGMEPGFGGDSGLLAALRDEERAATRHIEQLRREPGIGSVSGRAARLEHALAVLCNGLASYPKRWPPRSARMSGTPEAPGSASRWPSWSRPACAATARWSVRADEKICDPGEDRPVLRCRPAL